MYCFPINIIWIERGIILLILEHICDNYHSIKNKNIILENNKYRQFIQSIFKNLSFSQNSISNKDTFYFNIRKIIKNKNIIIDYLNNYNDFIPGTDVKLVPWFDYNDPLIFYIYNNNKKTSVQTIKHYLQKLYCNRGNFKGSYWDLYREKQILIKFSRINRNISWEKLFYLLNTYFKKHQKTFIINKNHFIPITIQKNSTDNKGNIQPEKEITINDTTDTELLNKLLKILSKKISIINDILD